MIRLTSVPVVLDEQPLVRVEVESCRIDAAMVVLPLGGADDYAIVNDDVTKRLARSTLVMIAGTWKLEGGVSIGDDETGDVSCDS